MKLQKPKILVVDDKPENIYTMEKLLKELDVDVFEALSGADALTLTLEHDFCLAIVDIQMPEMDGYELVELIRTNQSTINLPVIFVSAIFSDEYHHRKGYDAGAVDFLSKPFVPEILLSKINVFLSLYLQRQALEQANADKDLFLSIISHDLRSPFNAILANSRLLHSIIGTLSKQDIQKMAKEIYDSAQTASNLLENLLLWARLQQESGLQYKPQKTDLIKSIEEALDAFHSVATQKEIEIKNLIQPDIWVDVDRQMLEAIIRNLADNALNFTNKGGKVILEASNDPQLDYVTVTVEDTGIGMKQAELEDILGIKRDRDDPQSSKNNDKSDRKPGLGLKICKAMVEQNKGTIKGHSRLGYGTKISFTIPKADQLTNQQDER